MLKFKTIFTQKTCSIIGMIHVDALPGTPNYVGSFENIVEKAKHEANVFKKSRIDSVLIENMHDIPYVKSNKFGPEIVSSMSRVACEVKNIFYDAKARIPIGIQVLACGGKEGLAIAKSCQLDFIRNEGFVFAHIGDEGYIESNAGELLRYRKFIDAENVLIFNDIKKKHSSHAITGDISLEETAKAAKFFLTDGLILTGKSTGDTTDIQDLRKIYEKNLGLPILIGSGVTKENLKDYFGSSDALIIGSHFKENGHWKNELSQERIENFMELVKELRCS